MLPVSWIIPVSRIEISIEIIIIDNVKTKVDLVEWVVLQFKTKLCLRSITNLQAFSIYVGSILFLCLVISNNTLNIVCPFPVTNCGEQTNAEYVGNVCHSFDFDTHMSRIKTSDERTCVFST